MGVRPQVMELEARVPPHDLDAEQSVLGAILLDPGAISRVGELLDASDFYRENHRQIYRAAVSLFSQGEPIDNVTVSAELEKQGVLDRIGGRAHLALLEQSVPTAANVEYYARIVKERSYKRRLITAGAEIASLGYEDPVEATEAINQAQATILAIAADRVGEGMVPVAQKVGPWMGRLETQMASGSCVSGIASGWPDLDRLVGGFRPGDLTVIAARPSIGKSTLALNLALDVAIKQRRPVGLYSLEMSGDQVLNRMLCALARVDAQRVHRGELSDLEYGRIATALGPLSDAPIFLDDQADMDDLTFRMKARQAHYRFGIELIVVDFLQRMTSRGTREGNRVQEVSAIARTLKSVARELQVPVIAISSLSRSSESRTDKRPILSDLRDSGEIESEADIVMLLFRDDYYTKEKSQKPDILEVEVAKHRNGPTGVVELRFKRTEVTIDSLDRRRSSQ